MAKAVQINFVFANYEKRLVVQTTTAATGADVKTLLLQNWPETVPRCEDRSRIRLICMGSGFLTDDAPLGPRFPTFDHPTPINVSIRPLPNAPPLSRKTDAPRPPAPSAANVNTLPTPAPAPPPMPMTMPMPMPSAQTLPPVPVPAAAAATGRAPAYAPGASEPRPIAVGANPATGGGGRGSTVPTPSSDTGRSCAPGCTIS